MIGDERRAWQVATAAVLCRGLFAGQGITNARQKKACRGYPLVCWFYDFPKQVGQSFDP